jgi:archaellum component FlaC
MKKKPIAIEDLALMIGKGFEETATQTDELEKWVKGRFDNIDRELKGIRKGLAGVVYRHEFEELQTRVKELENLFAMPAKRR